MPPLRLGLLGGTFDPPHLGHLLVAQDVLEALALDRLVFIPAAVPPHKERTDLTPATLRLEMVREALDGEDRFEVSGVELEREGPSFTVDTLRHFQALYPGVELFFLMGMDQVAEFHDWQDPEIVAQLARLVAMSREGSDPEEHLPKVLPSGTTVEFLRVGVTRVDISSTDIRERVANRRSIQYLVPDAVREFIESHQLYRPDA